jgi:hypothetical protein
LIDARQLANAALAIIFAALMLIIGVFYLEYRADKSPQRQPFSSLVLNDANLPAIRQSARQATMMS